MVLRKYGATLKKYKNRTTDRVVRPTLDANKQVSPISYLHFLEISTEGSRLLETAITPILVGIIIPAASLLYCKSQVPYGVKHITQPKHNLYQGCDRLPWLVLA